MLAIIPARGGSKGLPGKNIKKLGDKPLIVYTIEAALNSKKIDRVIVSTDDQEIVEVCKEYIDVPFLRPSSLATDESLIIDTYLFTLDKVNELFNEKHDSLISLLPTCPLRTSDDIDNAIDIYENKNADSVISYYEAPHPVQWYKKINENGVLESVLEIENTLKNRQEENISYLPNGGIYIFNVENTIKKGVYYTDKTYPYLMPRSRSVDIDTLEDFEYAEFLIGRNKS